MATIRYTFADGHTEEVEVTEEFKREYEFLLVREQAPHWKEMKQKERAGLRCVKNLSLDKFSEDGYDLPVARPGSARKAYSKRGAPRILPKNSFLSFRKATASIYLVSSQRLQKSADCRCVTYR